MRWVQIQEASRNKDKAKYTKDYTGSNLHRYRISGSKNYAHICPPSSVLHVSNIDSVVTESQIKDLFAPFGMHGVKPLQYNFHFFYVTHSVKQMIRRKCI